MKTFDIALKYLTKSNLDFKILDIYKSELDEPYTEPEKKFIDDVQEVKKQFDADPDNTLSNDYYRSMCFCEALYHLIFKANNLTSFWDVACAIVEEGYDKLPKNYEAISDGSVYPKKMVDEWKNYQQTLNPCPAVLREDSEVSLEFFMGAWHYNVDDKS